MVFGIKIPKFFGKKRRRVIELIDEAKRLDSKELDREEVLAELFRLFLRFLAKSRDKSIQRELEKTYKDVETKNALLPYFQRLHVILVRIKHILNDITSFNERTLANALELKRAVEEHNNSMLVITPSDQKAFLTVCQDRVKEKLAIKNLLNETSNFVDDMVKVVNSALRDIENFDTSNVIRNLEMEKQKFFDIVQAQLRELGFEVRSLKDITELEGLSLHFNREFVNNSNSAVFDRKFVQQAKLRGAAFVWNPRIRKIGAIYVSMYFLIKAVFQIALPAYYATFPAFPIHMQHRKIVHYPESYEQLKQKENFLYVSFKSYDNLELSGYLIKNKNNTQTDKAMIFGHGRNQNATQMLPYVQQLQKLTEDVDFFAINMRHHGEDSAKWSATTMGLKEAFDIVGAINHLASRGYKEVVVYGYSFSGPATVIAVTELRHLISPQIEVAGIILEKTYSNLFSMAWETHKRYFLNPSDVQSLLTKELIEFLGGYKLEDVNPAKSIEKFKKPVMLIGTKEPDSYIKPAYLEELAMHAKWSGSHVTKVIVSHPDDSLENRHKPENKHPVVTHKMAEFVESVLH